MKENSTNQNPFEFLEHNDWIQDLKDETKNFIFDTQKHLFSTYNMGKLEENDNGKESEDASLNEGDEKKSNDPIQKYYKQLKRRSNKEKNFTRYYNYWKSSNRKPQKPELKNMTNDEWISKKEDAVQGYDKRIEIIKHLKESNKKIQLLESCNDVLLNKDSNKDEANATEALPLELIFENPYEKILTASEQFLLLFDKAFKYFCSLNLDDFDFLTALYRGNEAQRKTLYKQLDVAETVESSKIFYIMTKGEGKELLQIISKWSKHKDKDIDSSETEALRKIVWKKINSLPFDKEKLMIEFFKERDNIFQLYFSILEFGQKDTHFGEEEIKALIIFKYFLTEGARKKLLSEIRAQE